MKDGGYPENKVSGHIDSKNVTSSHKAIPNLFQICGVKP